MTPQKTANAKKNPGKQLKERKAYACVSISVCSVTAVSGSWQNIFKSSTLLLNTYEINRKSNQSAFDFIIKGLLGTLALAAFTNSYIVAVDHVSKHML